MPSPSPGYSVTIRVEAPASASATSAMAAAIALRDGALTALDVVESYHDRIVVDVTVDVVDVHHGEVVTDELRQLPEFVVRKVSDRTFLMHLGGKIEVTPKIPLRHRDDLSRAYTPGVARVCEAIAANPADARRLTIKRNTVAVVTDGSAVLGLGNLGPLAALPVMEGKCALFKRFAGVDAWPVCLDTQDADEIIEIVAALAPTYGGINLEDIAAPRCFRIELRLRERLDIPVFHDDQHGTAIVVLAALQNAARLVGKSMEDLRVVVSGAGAAGSAIMRLLHASGARDIIGSDINGILPLEHDGGPNLTTKWLAENTNPRRVTGGVRDGLVGADVFIGVSAPNVLQGEDLTLMADRPIVFALANPVPEVDPVAARRHAEVVATGRSDQPNQINNVLAFPGVFRGLLDAGAATITDEMLIAAADAIASAVAPDQLNVNFIVPSVFDETVAPAVAAAVRAVAAG